MTEVLLSLSGIHARSEKTIQATQDWERGRIGSKQLGRQFGEDVRQLIALQKTLGFEFISDGQLTTHWQDLLTPITTEAEGVKKGPLVRWFNTNTFYYVPLIESAISIDGRSFGQAVESRLLGEESSRVVLPDPLTFAECSDNKHYRSREELMFAYADDILSPILRSLESMGAGYLQLSAPSLVARFREEKPGKGELSQVAEAVRSALRHCHVRTGYHTFFGDAAGYLPFLLDSIATDDIGFDLTETDASKVGKTSKGIVAGVANARSSYVESPGELAKRVGGLVDKTERLVLAPSCDLRYVPRLVADEKLKNLARARRALS
ncbi:MAG: hypothetical protein LYZ69_00715 [Nitrososphaerales archaeon]|nr:hypothetical protein [Nitrososphaerales archaeon]